MALVLNYHDGAARPAWLQAYPRCGVAGPNYLRKDGQIDFAYAATMFARVDVSSGWLALSLEADRRPHWIGNDAATDQQAVEWSGRQACLAWFAREFFAPTPIKIVVYSGVPLWMDTNGMIDEAKQKARNELALLAYAPYIDAIGYDCYPRSADPAVVTMMAERGLLETKRLIDVTYAQARCKRKLLSMPFVTDYFKNKVTDTWDPAPLECVRANLLAARKYSCTGVVHYSATAFPENPNPPIALMNAYKEGWPL